MTTREWLSALLIAALVALVLGAVGVDHEWSEGTALGVAGLALSIAGFGLAIVQLERAQSKAQLAFDTIQDTLKAVAASRLSVVITQMRHTATEVEAAAERGDTLHTRLLLNEWRTLSQDAEGLVLRRFGASHATLASLKSSAAESTSAKAALFSGSTPKEAVKEALAAMAIAIDDLGPLMEQLLPQPKLIGDVR